MAQTNYGKFKVIPTQNAQISSNQPYTRGPGMPQTNAQYLPKLGGTSQGPSSAAYSGAPTQSASAQNQYFQQMQKSKVPTQQIHTQSQQNIGRNQGGVGMQSAQALNFRQNLNMSLQQI